MLFLLFCLSPITLALSNDPLNSTTSCRDNQWLCGHTCIHQRSFCTVTGECHSKYPRACGDGSRCYHRLDTCWEAGCLNADCEAADNGFVKSAPLSELDKTQAKFLLKCPDVKDRFSACPDPNYGHICFYASEWSCGSECIGKTDVCPKLKSKLNKGCDWGMKRCGEVCVDRHTPCNGICWDESSVHMCGNNMCLSQYQMQDYHVCNGTCYDHTVPCDGQCQSPDFYMCHSGDQCYRYWDHCDNEQHCDDASDEGGACKAREYIVYLVPILMLLFIGSLVIALICVRIRGCHLGQQRASDLQIEVGAAAEEEGEMAIITDLDQIASNAMPSVVLSATVNNNWHLTSGES